MTPPDARRVNIYLSADLASRLEAVKDQLKISKVCQDALERAVTGIETLAKAGRKDRVVSRLREAAAEQDLIYRRGQSAGQQWAELTASWTDMQVVAGWGNFSSSDQIITGRPPATSGVQIAMNVASLLNPQLPRTLYLPPTAPMRVPFSGEEEEVMYWRGFRDGVKEVFNEVRQELAPPASSPAPRVTAPKTHPKPRGPGKP